MLGADGIQMGTRFLASNECKIHENYKKVVLDAKDTDSVVTGRRIGHPARQIKNKMTKRFLELEKEGASFDELESLTIGSLRRAAKDGDLDNGSFMAGQIAGLVKEIKPCKKIIEELFSDADKRIMDISNAAASNAVYDNQ
jgi:enoyl-[acyl-carrier protein] reductase II